MKRLIELKVETLFHDPLYKSFLIKKYGKDFGVQHEREAKLFRNKVLDGTRFAAVPPEAKIFVGIYDSFAATVERKLIRYIEWPRGIYLQYDYLHNIFDPNHSVPLKLPSDWEGRINKVAEELNKILKEVDKLGIDDVALYNILYMSLEASWYAHDLSPALADTRIPTHTIFDHLYAATTMANIVNDIKSGTSEVDVGGYYILADFPGIQRFVGSGRKVGDFWASSWLLSNVMWGIAEKFAFKYGFDVVVSPTPRLNPYAIRSSFAKLPIEKTLSNLLTIKFLDELKKYAVYPLVPATISMVLPQLDLDSVDAVASVVVESYRESWRDIVEYVLNELEEKTRKTTANTDRGVAIEMLREKLREIKSVIEVPLQGVRVYVINIKQMYKAILDCLNGDFNKCRDLGLQVKDRLNEFERRLLDFVCGLNERCREFEEVKKDIAITLLWHMLYTKAIELAERFGTAKVPSPRSFWIYSDGALKSLTSYVEGWTPCVICGAEPAVIKFAKKPTTAGEVTFDFRQSEGLPKDLNLEQLEKNLSALENVFKPGESLGPYCLFKRILYMVKRYRDELDFVSTDDVALNWKSLVVNSLASDPDLQMVFSYENLASKLISKVDELRNVDKMYVEQVVKGILMPIQGKDIELSAKSLNISTEHLVNALSRILIETCININIGIDHNYEPKANKLVNELLSYINNIGASLKVFEEVMSLIKRPEIRGYRLPELCKILKIPVTFAILRSDADYIGAVHKGLKPKTLNEYINNLIAILKNALQEMLPSTKIAELSDKFSKLVNIFDALSINEMPVTPARTAALSLTLVLQAITDAKIVKENHGILIYSGGDDVLALVPAQTALKAALKLRRDYGEDRIKVFVNTNPVEILRMHIPLGRSISIRFANLKDLMNVELIKAFELLEGVAKEARWSFGFNDAQEKDTIIISDSRSGIRVVLPLGKGFALTEAAIALALLVASGTLSSGFSEDYWSMVSGMEQAPSNALRKIFEFVLKRNVTRVEKIKLDDEIVNMLKNWLDKAQNCSVEIGKGKEKSNLFEQVANLVAIVRRQI